MGEKMEKDAQRKLDELVYALQKELLQGSRGSEKAGTSENRYHCQGQEHTCRRIIDKINLVFGTNYESYDENLKKYFAPEKPCERS